MWKLFMRKVTYEFIVWGSSEIISVFESIYALWR